MISRRFKTTILLSQSHAACDPFATARATIGHYTHSVKNYATAKNLLVGRCTFIAPKSTRIISGDKRNPRTTLLVYLGSG